MCFPSNLSSSSFESDLEQRWFFFGEVGELAEVARYDDSFEPLATEEEAVSQCKNWSRSRTNIPVIPNHKHWNPSDNTTNLTVSHVCRVGVRQLFLTIAFISCRYGLICCCYVHRFVAVSWIVVRKILHLKITNPIIISSLFYKKSPHNATWKFFNSYREPWAQHTFRILKMRQKVEENKFTY